MSKLESSTVTSTGQETSTGKGRRVWLDLDQKALDDAYDQACWAPNREHLQKRRRVASEQTIARIGPPKRVALCDRAGTRPSPPPIHGRNDEAGHQHHSDQSGAHGAA